jgi:hypothetical protein
MWTAGQQPTCSGCPSARAREKTHKHQTQAVTLVTSECIGTLMANIVLANTAYTRTIRSTGDKSPLGSSGQSNTCACSKYDDLNHVGLALHHKIKGTSIT